MTTKQEIVYELKATGGAAVQAELAKVNKAASVAPSGGGLTFGQTAALRNAAMMGGGGSARAAGGFVNAGGLDIRAIKGTFGESSQFGGMMAMLKGGGAAVGLQLASNMAANFGSTIREQGELLRTGKINYGEFLHNIAAGTPIIGGFLRAFDELTGRESTEARIARLERMRQAAKEALSADRENERFYNTRGRRGSNLAGAQIADESEDIRLTFAEKRFEITKKMNEAKNRDERESYAVLLRSLETQEDTRLQAQKDKAREVARQRVVEESDAEQRILQIRQKNAVEWFRQNRDEYAAQVRQAQFDTENQLAELERKTAERIRGESDDVKKKELERYEREKAAIQENGRLRVDGIKSERDAKQQQDEKDRRADKATEEQRRGRRRAEVQDQFRSLNQMRDEQLASRGDTAAQQRLAIQAAARPFDEQIASLNAIISDRDATQAQKDEAMRRRAIAMRERGRAMEQGGGVVEESRSLSGFQSFRDLGGASFAAKEARTLTAAAKTADNTGKAVDLLANLNNVMERIGSGAFTLVPLNLGV